MLAQIFSGGVGNCTGDGSWHAALHRSDWLFAARDIRRRFDPVTIGLWLGGLALGLGGCILGVYMPYRHPVAVTISVIWWGTYLGCFGASVGTGIGGLFGRGRDRRPVCLRLGREWERKESGSPLLQSQNVIARRLVAALRQEPSPESLSFFSFQWASFPPPPG
jgi:hypothetical protein